MAIAFFKLVYWNLDTMHPRISTINPLSLIFSFLEMVSHISSSRSLKLTLTPPDKDPEMIITKLTINQTCSALFQQKAFDYFHLF